VEQPEPIEAVFGKELEIMKTLIEENLAAWATRISRNLHACHSLQLLKSPCKTPGMVRANVSSVMEPSALVNHTVAGLALPLLLRGGAPGLGERALA
jgi:hypothetical protein